jgi:hypothetical protein
MMKKIVLFLVLLTGLLATKAPAQMGAAQKITYDINKQAIVNMAQDQVWEILNQPELLQKASNGYASSITVKDANFPVVREVVFADGSKRTETIKQVDMQYKFMVIQLDNVSLPKGVSEGEILVFTRDKDAKCEILWKARIKGSDDGKKVLMEKLNAEFDAYAIGLDKQTKKSIPATPMN